MPTCHKCDNKAIVTVAESHHVIKLCKKCAREWLNTEVPHPTLDQCRCRYCGCNNYIEKPQWLNVCNDCYEGHQDERARNRR